MNVTANPDQEASLDAVSCALCAATPRVEDESEIGAVANLLEWLDGCGQLLMLR
jgi:hypothetical protein